ncbi:MAG TPA: response regulator [Rhizomicrobium sp.]|nr:response regulator [Rhizomicrobium sp.]
MTYSDPLVYVVDDNRAVRDSLVSLLTSNGITVRSFASSKDFLTRRAQGAKGCLVLDLYMPELSGLELLRLLRARGNTIPVIAISGRRDAVLDAALKRESVMAILSKPFNDEELLDLIDAALRAH